MSESIYQSDQEDYEMINGVTCKMARPDINHVQINGNICSIFRNYLKGKSDRTFCKVDVFLSKLDNVVPDVIIIRNLEIINKTGVFGTPDLIVEVSSPPKARMLRMEKFKLYEKYGVKEYWIVNPKSKMVDVYLNKDGKLVLDNVYAIIPDYEWNNLSEKKKALLKFEIKVSLYDDFYVKLEDIFEYVD